MISSVYQIFIECPLAILHFQLRLWKGGFIRILRKYLSISLTLNSQFLSWENQDIQKELVHNTNNTHSMLFTILIISPPLCKSRVGNRSMSLHFLLTHLHSGHNVNYLHESSCGAWTCFIRCKKAYCSSSECLSLWSTLRCNREHSRKLYLITLQVWGKTIDKYLIF